VESSVSRCSQTSRDAASTAAKIDWLNATFDKPAMSLAGLIKFINELLNGSVSTVLDGGLFGFTERHRLQLRLDDGAKVEIGSIALGGESQKGRWLLQLNGKGCGMVNDWPSLQELLEGLGATLSRVDLAVDFLNGEYTVDDALTLYETGAFINRGRNPELDTQGAWHESGTKGRTVYVGKLKNGKTLCVYEKGRQLNLEGSDWTRYEVRLGNRDREIPLDVLTNPDKYFTGAYPAQPEQPQPQPLTPVLFFLKNLKKCFPVYITQRSTMI
jgi:phage replication initiation protein